MSLERCQGVVIKVYLFLKRLFLIAWIKNVIILSENLSKITRSGISSTTNSEDPIICS